MAVKVYKPTTPARRNMTSQDFSEITTSKPVKSLLSSKKSSAGRNNQGKITVRHRGGGVKKHYRQINFKPTEGSVFKVIHIEYDPNRTARIARVEDQDGKLHYLIAGLNWKQGQKITVGASAPIDEGNLLPLSKIPVGNQIFNIELQPGKGAQICRSAGVSAQLMAKEGDLALIKLPSGERRNVPITCTAMIGTVGNVQHQNVKLGSAGRKRKMGIRPTVRGVVMNPVDHPHGGGEGRGKGNNPSTPWGKPTLGYKTRHNKRTQKMIVRSRHQAKRRKG
ncbi:MAG: 50S ribosomal protein L2 [Candidatus Nomurabacteria bacterium]|nr:MAG: 50S ribosomal protein L2 [Candidatus Nomurabacteria bacterium]HRV76162.1 50S ribosomal protein L2 [Candidatus Saccharimonadales bacterium]